MFTWWWITGTRLSYVNFLIPYYSKHVWPHLQIGCITPAYFHGRYCRQRSNEIDFKCKEEVVTVLTEALQTWELRLHEFVATTLINGSELLAWCHDCFMPRETPRCAPNLQGTSHCWCGCLGKEKNLPFLGLFSSNSWPVTILSTPNPYILLVFVTFHLFHKSFCWKFFLNWLNTK